MKLRRSEERNAAAELADMRLAIDSHEDGTAVLRLHLTFGYAELPLDEKFIRVSAREAILRVATEGVEIDSATKFGERIRVNSARTTVTQESVRKTQSSAGGSLSLDASPTTQGGAASLALNAKRDSQDSSTSVSHTELEQLRVEALGGDRWRIREFENPGLLAGRYLGNEALCSVRIVGRANRRRVEVTVEIKQRDLTFDPRPDRLFGGMGGSTNRDKLTRILMAKSLHAATGSERSFDGILVVSAGTCDEDEE